MIRKLEKVVIAFPTTTDVMDMECLCKERGIPGRVIPVPGAITADCGLAWCSDPPLEGALLELMEKSGISYQGVYHLLV